MNEDLKEQQTRTIEALLDKSKRTKGVPFRNDFVQRAEANSPAPGLLGELIRSSNGRSLDLYLLLRMVASAEPWDVRLEAGVWAKALGLGADKFGKDAVSSCWKTLRDYRLINNERKSRLAQVTPLHEDGSGESYSVPNGGYFTLPIEYWKEDWSVRLKPAGKAALLIGRSLKPGFYLPPDKMKAWYGITAETIRNGLNELEKNNLLTYTEKTRKDWLKSDHNSLVRHYTLLAPFNKGSINQLDGLFHITSPDERAAQPITQQPPAGSSN